MDPASFMKKLDQYEEKLVANPTVSKIKGQLQGFGLPPEVKMVYIAFASVAFCTLILLLTSGVRALGNVVAWLYPVWASLKALGSEDKDDDTFWLAYWIFYSSIQLVESITDVFLFWIPMYEWIKIALYIYMWHPKTQGAMVLYRTVLKPLVAKGEEAERHAQSVLGQMRKVD